MEDRFDETCNAVEFVPESGRKAPGKRNFVVVDGRNQEFRKELNRQGLKHVKEWFKFTDPRTNCVLRFYKVRPEDVDAFQQAALDLAEHMPALGYPDYEDYALRALVKYECISPDEVRKQTGKEYGASDPSRYNPDAVFNCACLRTGFPSNRLWQDVVVVEGREREAVRLLEERGFANLEVKNRCTHRDWPQYVIFSCRIPKKRSEEFLDAMRELEKRMLIFGYRDYEKACEAFFRSLEKMAG